MKSSLAILLLSASVSASTQISAGRWEITNQLETARFDGRSDDGAFPAAKPQTSCLTEAAAAKGPGLAFTDSSDCEVSRTSMQNGVFSFETVCKATESADVIVTKATGTYTADRYEGRSISIQRRGGTRIEMQSRMKAKRLGAC